MNFIIDTQLPPNLESFFSWKGHVGKHTTQWPSGYLMSDKEIISIARMENFIIVTKDKDFLNHFLVHGAPPSILLLSVGNLSNHQLAQLLSLHFEQIETSFRAGANLIILEPERLIFW